MAQRSYEVKPLFAEPYFTMDISDAIDPGQVEKLKKLAMRDNQINLISEELFVFKRKEFASIARAVQQGLDIFAEEVMGISQKLEVTQSWTLTNRPGAAMHGHSHSNSIVSGSLYYAPLPDPVANMVFERHTSYQALAFNVRPDKTNIYSAQRNVIVPKQGMLVLFPSKLQHYVEPNQATTDRHSIAFNSFVRGTIGDLRDVSQLTL